MPEVIQAGRKSIPQVSDTVAAIRLKFQHFTPKCKIGQGCRGTQKPSFSEKLGFFYPSKFCLLVEYLDNTFASPREGMLGRRMERQRTIPGRRTGNHSLNLYVIFLLRRLAVRIRRAPDSRLDGSPDGANWLPLNWAHRHLAVARSAPAVAQEGRDIQILCIESARLEFSILRRLLFRNRRDRVIACF